MNFFYLHGFASSPHSRKATLFIEKLRQFDIRLQALDLAPDFESLTITSQLEVIEKAAAGQPSVLIGSSLGGYLAALFASFHPEVNRLLLLAPAFDFYSLWLKEFIPAKLKAWRETGAINVYHYGMGRETRLGIQLLDDAKNYPAFPVIHQPCMILHGRNDSVVPFANSEHVAASYPGTTRLLPLDSDHELTDVLDEIWNSSRDFLLGATL